ncbi:unnamed protein product [Oppiella nova]|uniref:Carboxypeptidase n=1 Tax=Oppiella nova TaxID=334625 RepID=A0A7R9LMY3_9ACAR|nr:unnamed protein product [Oppiella nova]CAG2165252.1 unnamed protein product [Oppiella nova]
MDTYEYYILNPNSDHTLAKHCIQLCGMRTECHKEVYAFTVKKLSLESDAFYVVVIPANTPDILFTHLPKILFEDFGYQQMAHNMDSEDKECFTRGFLRKCPHITDQTIDVLISHGFRDRELLLVLDTDKDLPLIDIPLSQKAVLRLVLSQFQRLAQKDVVLSLQKMVTEDITETNSNIESMDPQMESSATLPVMSECMSVVSDTCVQTVKEVMDEEEDNTCHPLEKKSKVSLNAMKGTEEECYAKDSFDRFGDDLCEEMLSYLSLKDSFRYECLSKQWKRSVFTTRHALEVKDQKIDNLSIKRKMNGSVDWEALETLLKKLPNIRSIDITIGCDSYLSIILFERLVKLMKHLNAIHITFVSMDDKILNIILPQYGSRVASLVFEDHSYNFDEWCHKSCHNFKTLCFDDSEDGLSRIYDKSNDILFKSLTQFSFVYSSYNLNAFTLFTDHYTNCLKSIAMILCKLDGKGIEDVLHRQNDFYITGESYAGKYVPAIAYKIHSEGKASNINLKGIAIGNGWIDPVTQLGYGPFLYQTGLIDENQRDYVNTETNKAIEFINNKNYLDAFKTIDILTGLWSMDSYFRNATGLSFYYNYLFTNSPEEFNYYSKYLELEATRRAIHVGNLTYNDGNKVMDHLMANIMQSVKPWLTTLMDADYKVMLFSGQLDIIVAATLTENFIESIKWSKASQYKSADRLVWKVSDKDTEVAGYVRVVHNFYQVIVRNGGHILAYDEPRAALDMITRFVMLFSGQLDIIVAATLTENFIQSIKWSKASQYKSADRLVWKVSDKDTEVAGYVRVVHNFYQVIVRNGGHILAYH